jgi:peroxiredoxin
MELNRELDKLLQHTLRETTTELASAVAINEKTIRDSRLVETALHQGQTFSDFSLPDSNGAIVRSEDLLALGPLIVSFYRGQWCPFCNLELNALQLALPEIEELEGDLVAISPETPEQISKALTRSSYSFYLLSDRGNALARKVGLVYRVPAEMQAEFRKANIHLPAINGDDSCLNSG